MSAHFQVVPTLFAMAPFPPPVQAPIVLAMQSEQNIEVPAFCGAQLGGFGG